MNEIFRPPRNLSARWRPAEGEGLEHLTLLTAADDIVAMSVVVGNYEGAFGACYRVLLDRTWRVKDFSVELTDGRALHCRSPEPGRWFDGEGVPLAAFDGCIDIDLSVSPFTNTLPIRRVGIARGEAREFAMFYVPFDSLEPFVDEQRYTCLEPGRRYLYEAVNRTFTGELTVDEDGLVIEFAGICERVWPS